MCVCNNNNNNIYAGATVAPVLYIDVYKTSARNRGKFNSVLRTSNGKMAGGEPRIGAVYTLQIYLYIHINTAHTHTDDDNTHGLAWSQVCAVQLYYYYSA